MRKFKTNYGFDKIDNNVGINIINIYNTRSTLISSVVFFALFCTTLDLLVNINQHFYNNTPAVPRDVKILHGVKYSTTFSVPIFLEDSP